MLNGVATRPLRHVRVGGFVRHLVGSNWFQFLAGRYLVARHQYRCNNRHVSDGLRDPERAKPRYSGSAAEAGVNTEARNSLMGLEGNSESEVQGIKSALVNFASSTDTATQRPSS
jgi:hypothetical protein